MKWMYVLMLALLASACSKVPAGHVGIKVYLLGGSKGVDHEVLGVGRYWIGMNEDLYLYPTFQQNVTWAADGDDGDESITFQTKEGLQVNGDFGISYHLDSSKIPQVFQKYRKGIEEITDIFLRNHVRDAMNQAAATLSVEDAYGLGKQNLLTAVQETVSKEVAAQGIVIDKLYVVGSFRLPKNVIAALNSKIEATQKAQQRENEVQEAKAQAAKDVAEAEGKAQAKLALAKAEAEANRLKQLTLTDELIRYETIQKWNGALPQVSSGATPIISLGAMK